MKERLWIYFGDGAIHIPIAIMTAAFVGTLFSLPIDNLKTRM